MDRAHHHRPGKSHQSLPARAPAASRHARARGLRRRPRRQGQLQGVTTAPRPKPRGSRRTLTHANLVALGAERLADLALELADEQPVVKRRLRLELAAASGPDVLAAEIDKALATMASRRGRVPWRKYKALVLDLDLQRRLIAGQLAKAAPALAFELMGR